MVQDPPHTEFKLDFQNQSYQSKIDFQKQPKRSYQGAELGLWNYFRTNNLGFCGVTDFEIWEFRSIWKRDGRYTIAY